MAILETVTFKKAYHKKYKEQWYFLITKKQIFLIILFYLLVTAKYIKSIGNNNNNLLYNTTYWMTNLRNCVRGPEAVALQKADERGTASIFANLPKGFVPTISINGLSHIHLQAVQTLLPEKVQHWHRIVNVCCVHWFTNFDWFRFLFASWIVYHGRIVFSRLISFKLRCFSLAVFGCFQFPQESRTRGFSPQRGRHGSLKREIQILFRKAFYLV